MRRTFADIDAHARAHERVAMKGHAAQHVERLRKAAASGRISGEAADAAARQVTMFADDVLSGLHVDDENGPMIRKAVRALLAEEAANG